MSGQIQPYFAIEKTIHASCEEKFCSHVLKICCIRCGSGIWNIEGKEYPIEIGDIFILSNNEKRNISTIYEPGNIILDSLVFEPEFICPNKEDLRDVGYLSIFFNRPDNFSHRIPAGSSVAHEIGILIGKIDLEIINKKPEYDLVVKIMARNILIMIKRYFSTYAHKVMDKERPPNIKSALKYIDENYTDEIRLDKLANMSLMSESRFSRLFKQIIGINFSDYIIKLRVGKAINLLNESDMKVIDIALESGFNNATNFYKAFKKLTGKTPKEYRDR